MGFEIRISDSSGSFGGRRKNTIIRAAARRPSARPPMPPATPAMIDSRFDVSAPGRG